ADNIQRRQSGEDFSNQYAFRWITKTGETRVLELMVGQIVYGGRPAIIGNFTDITEVREAQEMLRRNYDLQKVLNSLLRYQLSGVSIDDILKHSLDEIKNIPWLVFESKCAILLVDDTSGNLVMKVQSGFPTLINTECSNVPFGKCLCGRAALSGTTEFSNHIDERHEIRNTSMTDHGHYCIPILSSSAKVLGVITIYVKAGHQRNRIEEEFLTAVADVLSSIINYKNLEKEKENLRENVLQKTLYLYRFSHEISPSTSENELYDFIVTNAIQAVGADAGSLFALISSTGSLSLGTAIGQSLPVGSLMDSETKIAKWVLQNNKPLLIQHAVNTLPQFADIESRDDIVSSLVVPLCTDKSCIGVICLNRFKLKTNCAFTSHDLESMETFALHASLVVTGIRHARELKELDKMKSWFLSNVSHEIRTPITAISGALSLLKPIYSSGPQHDRTTMFIDLIMRNINRMQYLVNDLLDFSRMEHAQFKLIYSFFNINDVLHEVIEDIELLFKEKHLAISMEVPGEVKDIFGDRDKISQVITNLMGNAAKFTPPNGWIKVGYVFKDSGRMLIYIADSGPGIAADQHEKIFDKFYQIDGSLQREHGGFGLGLAIVKTIVEKHNGKIWVESQNNKGATFFIDLPYVPQQPEELPGDPS
ncbi:MAG: ATP-binding protein, partial [Endomicrobiales bacterium]